MSHDDLLVDHLCLLRRFFISNHVDPRFNKKIGRLLKTLLLISLGHLIVHCFPYLCRIKGSPLYEAILGSDGYALVPVTLNKAYEFIVISVDGYFRTESDTVEVSINS